jgi:methionyl-tRNA synthetase
MPASMGKMLDQLGVPADQRSFADLNNALLGGISLPTPQGVFPRWVEEAAVKP